MNNFIYCLLLISLTFFSESLLAQSKTTKYTYDALGRLTFVTDPVNGNRDYDYDKAGNRLLVATNTASDAASEPGAPSAPTGLQSNHFANCVHQASWNPSSSSAPGLYYFVRESRDAGKTTTSTTIYINCDYNDPSSNKPRSVTACNSVGCSAEVYFTN
jgi:YD repeat-containing protein